MSRVDVALGLLLRGDRCFLQRRDPAAAVLPGLWEFPGGKARPGESPEAALRRELREELDWEAERCEALAVQHHDYPGRSVALHPFLCAGAGRPRTRLAWGWFTAEEMGRLPIPDANHRLLEALAGFWKA
jgi:mutator protein MutT